MTDEEYAAYDAEWCRLVIDLTLEKLPEAEYLEAQSKVVQDHPGRRQLLVPG